MNTTETFDTEKARQAQKDLCKEKEYPHFAPLSGTCYNCGNNIYERLSVEKAGSSLITGCPFCCRSYCD